MTKIAAEILSSMAARLGVMREMCPFFPIEAIRRAFIILFMHFENPSGSLKDFCLLSSSVRFIVRAFQTLESKRMLQIISEAGWPIWLNIIASVIGMAIILDRLWHLRKNVCVPRSRENAWQTALQMQPPTLPENAQNTVLDRIIYAAAVSSDRSRDALQDAMENQARIETVSLERFLTTLGTIAAMAPLMGLLGTVIGMIEIFASQSPSQSDPAQLARGISIALYNTAFGLMVAIPAMIFYRHFRARVEHCLADAETAANRLWHIMTRR